MFTIHGGKNHSTLRKTTAYSPDLAVWLDSGGRIAVLGLNGDGVPKGWKAGLKINKTIEDGWKDPEFPHNDGSIGTATEGCRWLRALSLHPHPVLFAEVEPSDACQGSVGNCWLLAATRLIS